MNKVFIGDCRETMRQLIAEGVKVQMCVTSPPFWGLRDYGVEPTVWGGERTCLHDFEYIVSPFGKLKRGEIQSGFCQKCSAWLGCFGHEPTPDLYVEHAVEVFRLVRDLLTDSGTLWLDLGDCYAGSGCGTNDYHTEASRSINKTDVMFNKKSPQRNYRKFGLKAKDLVGIPWRVAFALQASGWWLRSDIIEEVELYCPCGCGYVLEERIWRYSQDRDIVWEKPNPMPEAAQDRPTRSHEYIFLLSKSRHYYYDYKAIQEPASSNTHARYARGRANNHKYADGGPGNQTIAMTQEHMRKPGVNPKAAMNAAGSRQNEDFSAAVKDIVEMRNKRSVWTVSTASYPGSHFATYPPKLIEPCILAGSRPGDIVVDPFFGSGTTGAMAESLGRQWIGCELNPQYEPLWKRRTAQCGIPFGVKMEDLEEVK